jgi:UDP-N-acetylglucosamine--N-acetylmuramyl-(pentapeptide) pyrophosphoryl-undecaprenol N-acetylglucosamine transferase
MANIIFSGGGSGGHFYPLIAVARELKKNCTKSEKDIRIYLAAPENPDEKVLKKEGIVFISIMSGKLRRYFSIKNLISPFLILIGFVQSLVLMHKISPSFVFLKGGYGALPTGLAALVFKVPIFIHESDNVPGLMNKIFHRFSKISFVAFSGTFGKDKKVKLVGNPVRDMSSELSKKEAMNKLNIKTNKPIILISGGSQGSTEINELTFNLLDKLQDKFFIIHTVGRSKIKAYEEKISTRDNVADYQAYPFLNEDNFKIAYKACDLIVSRAGSGMIFEIALNEKPSILIPLMTSAGNHQVENAYNYMHSGACVVIENSGKNPQIFLDLLKKTTSNKEKLRIMSLKAKDFSVPDSAKKVANVLSKYLC